MKKNKSVILGILIIVVVCIATGCMFYNVLDSTDFKEHFGALGYTISNDEESNYEAKSYLVATKDDVPFKIEYYEFETEVDAKKVYQDYKENIANYITTDSQNKQTEGAVFTKCVAVSTDEYIVISRVKNTFIFIAGTNDYQEEIDTLLEDINY